MVLGWPFEQNNDVNKIKSSIFTNSSVNPCFKKNESNAIIKRKILKMLS